MRKLFTFGMILATALAQAQTVSAVETFNGRLGNLYEWSFGSPYWIAETGGNVGAFLGSDDVLVEFPTLTSAVNGFGVGNYRDQELVFINVDLRIPFSQVSGHRPMFLMLLHDNGTADPSDDTAALLGGPEVAEPSNDWAHISFPVPSQDDDLPEGWQLIRPFGAGQPLHSWAELIQDVSQLAFVYGDPTGTAVGVERTIHVDNISLVLGDMATAGDFDRSGRVDVLDFVALVELARDECPGLTVCRGDLNGTGSVDIRDIHWGAPSWAQGN